MKQLLITTIALITFFSCKAQQIIPLYDGSDYLDTNNAYYKDNDGDYTKLSGTWQYTNGNEIFELILKKKIKDTINSSIRNISYFRDFLYGEFKYVDSNGTEVINTLNQIDSFNDISEHLIYGGYIKGKYSYPVCEDCFETERRVEVSIKDPERSYFNYEMIIRHIAEDQLLGNPEQIKIRIKPGHLMTYEEGQPSDHRLPTYQEIVLTKQ